MQILIDTGAFIYVTGKYNIG